MNAATPKDAIIAFLSTPSIILSEGSAPDTQPQQGQTSIGGFGAKSETIRFIKERSLPHRQLHFVICEDEQGMQWSFTCEVVQGKDGSWRLRGAGAGGGGIPRHSSPRIYIGGSGDDNNQFYAGGYVGHNGSTIARVQLVFANNIVLEDTVENDIVLFLDDRFIKFPIEARLYDAQGALLNTHPVLPG